MDGYNYKILIQIHGMPSQQYFPKFDDRHFMKTYQYFITDVYTVELQWLEHHLDHENLFETGVVWANEGWL